MIRDGAEDGWFKDWRSPSDAFRRADELRLRLGAVRFFTRPGDWLREVWTLSRLGIAIGADGVRLAQADPPDGYLRHRRAEYPVEVTEAGDRFFERKKERMGAYLAGQAVLARAQREFPSWVTDAWRKKVANENKKTQKKAPAGTALVVHLNSMLPFLGDEEIWYRLRPAVPDDCRPFSRLIVLHGSGCYFFDDDLIDGRIVSFRREAEDRVDLSQCVSIESIFNDYNAGTAS
jgi:hypothetical protein